MSRFMRLFSGRWNVPQPSNSTSVKQGPTLVCRVQFLDGTNFEFEVPKKAYGSVLYQKVFNYMDLIETDYFGLQFMDDLDINRWLEVNKPIKKQVYRTGQSARSQLPIFQLKVKFYSSQPSNLKEEITRYQVYLQVKQDVFNGKLPCTFETAVDLAALVLQSDLGDFDPSEQTHEIVSEFRFVPNQTKDMEMAIFQKYKSFKGMSPGLCEMTYLNKARWLDLYGVDFHYVQGRDGNDYTLGLVPAGILIFEKLQKIGLFYWPKITQLQFKKNNIILKVVESDDKGVDREHTFIFRCTSERYCKTLWKCAVEHHGFFRLSGPSKPVGMKHSFLRIGSRFRYSGNTELQSLTSVRARKSVTFERKHSNSQRTSRATLQSTQSSNTLGRQSLRTRQDQETQDATYCNNNEDGCLTIKRSANNTNNNTTNRQRSSKRFQNQPNVSIEMTHQQHHHHQQQHHHHHHHQQQQDEDANYKKKILKHGTQSSQNDQEQHRSRTRSAESPGIRNNTPMTTTTTTTTTIDYPTTTSSISKRTKTISTKSHTPDNSNVQYVNNNMGGAYVSNNTNNNIVGGAYVPNNNPIRSLSPQADDHSNVNKRITDNHKQDTSNFNRRGDPRFQSNNIGVSPVVYNADGTMKNPRKTFSASNMMDVPQSEFYGTQRPRYDWLKASTNHTVSPPPTSPEVPFQNNFKENKTKTFHSSLQKKQKSQPAPLSTAHHPQERTSLRTSSANRHPAISFHEQTTQRLPLTSSSNHNQFLNHSKANNPISTNFQQPMPREMSLSPAYQNSDHFNYSQSAGRNPNNKQLMSHSTQEQGIQPLHSPYGFIQGQMVAKQQLQTRRVVQRDERSKSVVILTTEV